MSNRVIKDSIWSSPSLSKLSMEAQLHWPRLLLMADDWGCFNADPAVIFGLVYPKMAGMTIKKAETLLQIYFEAGMLFKWQEDERIWGYFVSWNGHQFCNATNVDDEGKNQKHRRKTPEPPQKEFGEYLNIYLYKKQGVSEKLEHFRTAQNKILNPNPIPNPNPNPNPNPKNICDIAQKTRSNLFEEFWEAYPARNGKKLLKAGAKSLFAKIKDGEFSQVMQAVRNYASSTGCRNGFTKDAVRFLRSDYWKDWLEPEKTQEVKNAGSKHTGLAEKNYREGLDEF